jgi:hypothetical protein
MRPRNCVSSTSPAQQLLQLLVRRAGLRRLPVVPAQLADRPRRLAGQRVELGLAEACVVRGIGEQRRTFLADGLVEQRADLLEGAVEPAALAHLLALLAHAPEQVVEARRPSVPRRNRSRSASRGVAPRRTSSPMASRARRTSYGGASGSGPSCHAPYR